MRGIHLANNPEKGFSGTPLLSLEKAALKIDILALLKFQVKINEIRVDGLHLNYEILENGHTSLDGLFAKSAQDTTPPTDWSKFELPGTFLLQKFKLRNSQIQYWDRTKKQKVIFGNITQDVSLSLDKKLENTISQGELRIQELRIEDEKLGIKKGGLNISVKHDFSLNLPKQLFKLRELNVQVQQAQVSIKGQLAQFLDATKKPTANLEVQTSLINLGQLIKEVPASVAPIINDISLAGQIKLFTALQLTETDSLPKIQGNLSLQNIAFSHKQVPAQVTNLNGLIQFTESSLSITPFSLFLANNKIELLAQIIGLPNTPVVQKLNINAGVDLAGALALAQKFTVLPAGFDVKGFVQTQLDISGKVDPAHPENLSVKGQSELQNVVARLPGVSLPVSASGQVNYSNTEVKSVLKAAIGTSDLALDAQIKDWLSFVMPKLSNGKTTQANIKIKSDNIHLDSLLASLQTSEEKQKEARGELPQAWPELPKVNLNMNMLLQRTTFKHLDLQKFEMNVTRSTSGLISQKSSGQVLGGTLSQNVTLNIHSPQMATMATSLNVSGVDANNFISNFRKNFNGNSPWEKNLQKLDNTFYGKLTLDLQITGQGVPATLAKSLNGPISVKIREGKIAESPIVRSYNSALQGFKPLAGTSLQAYAMKEAHFKNFDAALALQDGQLAIKDFKLLSTSLGDFSLNGLLSPEGALNLNLENILPKALSQSILKIQNSAKSALTAGLASTVNSASAVPTDKQNNVLTYFKIGGTLLKPQFSVDTEKLKAATSLSLKSGLLAQQKALQDQAKAKATEEFNKVKAQAESKAREEANKAKAQAEARAREEAAKATNKAKTETKKVIGDQLKKFGF